MSVWRLVRIARLGLILAIQSNASSRLKWLGCGLLRSASTIQTSSPASAEMLSAGRLLVSAEDATLPKRKPRDGISRWSCSTGSASTGPPCPLIAIGLPATRRFSVAMGGYSLPGGVMKQEPKRGVRGRGGGAVG